MESHAKSDTFSKQNPRPISSPINTDKNPHFSQSTEKKYSVPASVIELNKVTDSESLPPPYSIDVDMVVDETKANDNIKTEADIKTAIDSDFDSLPEPLFVGFSQENFLENNYPSHPNYSYDELDNYNSEELLTEKPVFRSKKNTNIEEYSPAFPPISPALSTSFAENIQSDKNTEKYDLENKFSAMDWQAFVNYCQEQDFPPEYLPFVQLSQGFIKENLCVILVDSETALHQLKIKHGQLHTLLNRFLAYSVELKYTAKKYSQQTQQEMKSKVLKHELILELQKEFGASLIRCKDLNNNEMRRI